MTDPQPASSPEPLALPRTDALALSIGVKALTFNDPCRRAAQSLRAALQAAGDRVT